MSQPLDELADLLRQEPTPDSSPLEVRLQQQTEWRRDLDALMNQISTWLRELIEGGLLTFDRREVLLREDVVDEYAVSALALHTPSGRTVDVLPLGRWTPGPEGRVDIVSPPRRARLLRHEEPATGQKGGYFVSVPDANGKFQLQPLTQDSLAAVLQELLS